MKFVVRDIVRDEYFLGQKSEKATREDIGVAANLLDTLKAHAHHCVGLAANMIGEQKCIIAVKEGLDVSVAVLETAETARKQAGIVFPCDGKVK